MMSLLVSHVASEIEPKSFDKVFGPARLVDQFVETWAAELRSKGVQLEVPPPFWRSKVSYATLASIPPPSPAFAQYRIELATEEDINVLGEYYADFSSARPADAMFIEEGRAKMKVSVPLGEIWVCRLNGEIAGYCATGRVTNNTIAIRNVYVSRRHRRKGVAEAMTRAMTRYFLGATPLGFEGALAAVPREGVKREVCLNVAEEHVERLYKRCGFLFGEPDPESGKTAWYPTTFRGIDVLEGS